MIPQPTQNTVGVCCNHITLFILYCISSRLVRVRTHRQSRVESSRVESHESCRVKSLDAACSIFVSQALVIGRNGCCLEDEMDVEKLILLVKDHETIYDASWCEHRNRVLH